MAARIPPDALGDRVRRLRNAQGLSIREVADRAGISKTSLMRLERGGRARPTTLLAVCNVLGVHLNRVVEPDGGGLQLVAVHRRRDDRWHDLRDFGSGPLGGDDRPVDAAERRRCAEAGGAIPLCMLQSRLPDSAVFPSVLELFGPTASRRHPGLEFVYVLSGRLELHVGDAVHELAEGESAAFRSAEDHRYAPAPGSAKPARVLSLRVEG